MESYLGAPLAQPAAATAIEHAFAVRFSNPSFWVRFGAQRKSYWKLAGNGQCIVAGANLILRGRRPRSFWVSAAHEITVPLNGVVNVVQTGRAIQCAVQTSDAQEQSLQIWAADEKSAQEIAALLPRTRTTQFERLVAEQSEFAAALQALHARAIATPGLALLNCAVFVVTAVAGAGVVQPNAQVLIHWGTNYGPLTLQGEWWRLFTSMFLHFGLIHLLFNMWALLSIGQLTERLFGSVYFLVLYLFAGLTGSIASLLWNPNVNSAGASGAIFGVLGGLLAFVLNPKSGVPASIATPQRNSALIFAAYNLFNGFAHSGIDNAAHIGGLAGGFALGWWFTRPLEVAARANPAPRLLSGVAAAVVILIAESWPLTHPNPVVDADRRFRQQLQLFSQDERRALDAERALNQQRDAHTIATAVWGRRVTQEVVPKWQIAEARVALVKLPADSSLLPLRTALLHYLDERRMGYQLLGDGAAEDNAQQEDAGTAQLDQSDQDFVQVAALFRKAF